MLCQNTWKVCWVHRHRDRLSSPLPYCSILCVSTPAELLNDTSTNVQLRFHTRFSSWNCFINLFPRYLSSSGFIVCFDRAQLSVCCSHWVDRLIRGVGVTLARYNLGDKKVLGASVALRASVTIISYSEEDVAQSLPTNLPTYVTCYLSRAVSARMKIRSALHALTISKTLW